MGQTNQIGAGAPEIDRQHSLMKQETLGITKRERKLGMHQNRIDFADDASNFFNF